MHALVSPNPFGSVGSQNELAERISRHVSVDGVHPSPLRGLTLVRYSTASQPCASLYEPSLCIVVQGRKRAVLGEDVYVYDPLNYLVVSMTLPARSHVIEATPERPYLCLRISVDVAVISELLLQVGSSVVSKPATDRGFFVARTSAPLLDAVLRLTALLDQPADAAVLSPLVLREIHYRVLTGEWGCRLRDLCAADSHAHRISRVIKLLKSGYAAPLRIDDLASAVHMSASSLHHKFKEVTAMSPLQFQKQMRLHEARKMMLAEGIDAAVAAHRVGYESASQFSREYRRLFGSPPRREIDRIRAGSSLHP